MTRIICMVLVVLLAGACSKEEKKDAIYVKINPEVLKYLKFEPGKYYIYRDSATGRLDSVLLTENTLTTKHVPGVYSSWGSDPEYITEAIQIIMHRYGDSMGVNWFKAYGQAQYLRFSLSDTGSISLAETIQLPGGGEGQIFGAFSSLNYSFPMTVEGVTYPNVIPGSNNPAYYSISPRAFYWAKNVGIIKRALVLNNIRYVSTLVRHGKN